MSIESVYQSLLRRNPDPGAYGTYAGWSDEDIANAIYGSQEYANLQQQSQPQQQQPQEQPYTPGPSYGDYNFEMTGKPSDQELATNPDVANAWYRWSGTSPAPAPTTPPIWLRPEDYTSNNFAAPYTQQQANAIVNPNDIRQGAGGVSYAAINGPSSYYDPTTAGEYIVDPKTGTFLKDKSGNLIPVPRPNTTSSGWFNDWGVLALPLLAAGGVTALESLGALGGAEAAGAAGSGSWGLTPEVAAELGLDYSTSGLTDLSGNAGSAFLASLGLNTAGPAAVAAAASTAPAIASILGTSLSTASTLAKLLGPASSLFNNTRSPNVSPYLPTALRNTVPTTTPTGSVNPVQVGAGSNQSPLPGVYQEQFAPYVFGNQQPVQTPRGGGYDFMSALNKPLDTSVLGQMKNVTPTNNAQNQAQNAKLNFFSSLFA